MYWSGVDMIENCSIKGKNVLCVMFERYKKYFRQSYINNWVFPLGIWEFRLKILFVSLKMCSDACSPSREWFFVHSIYN